MKRRLSLVLIIATLLAVVSLCTACYSPDSGGLLFTEAAEGYAVTGFSGKERFYKDFTVDIPSEYNGQPVTEISDGAFAGYTSLVKVTIPDTVTTISGGAFFGCILLSEIELPESVTFIGDAAFGGCISLSKINLPDSVTYIDSNAFHDCTGLVNVRIPESVMHIGEDAFAGSDAVAYTEYKGAYYLGNEGNPYKALIKMKDGATDLTIHSGTSAIQMGMLEDCPSLTSITFEGDILAYYDEWGNATYPYRELSNLSAVTINASSIPERAFSDCPKLTEVITTDCVESIGSAAFSGCESLLSVTVSGSVTEIGNHAFRDCGINDVYYTGSIEDWCNIRFGADNANPLYCWANMYLGGELLTELVIPNTVTVIPEFAFSNCQSIKSVAVSDSVTVIGDYAFAACRSLERADLPDSLTTIGNSAFWDCRALAAIEIPGSVTSIGVGAFSRCETLTSEVIPSSITDIPNELFYGCSSLQDIEIPDTVVSVGKAAFQNVPAATNEYDNAIYIGSVNNPYHILLKAKDTQIKTCEIHSDTRIIAGGAFEGCKALESIALPDGVVSIGDFAFANCEELESVDISATVTRIDRRAFENCDSLRSIVLPASITDMGSEVFYKCKSITVYCEASQQSIESKNWSAYWDYDKIPVVWDYKGE